MTEARRRRLAALITFFLTGFALLATTPGPPTARANTSGELFVAPDEPARVEARFTVSDPAPDMITRVAVNRLIGGGPGDPIAISVVAMIEGGDRQESDDGYRIGLDPAECTGGCQVVATIDVAWRGDPGPGLRVAWSLELEVEYGNTVPGNAIAGTVVVLGDASPPRLAWLGLGALVATAAAIGLWLIMPRLALLRLALAAGLLVVAAWPLVTLGPYLVPVLAGRMIIGYETVALTCAGLALGIGGVAGIARAAGGRATMLRVIGWMAALAVGYIWWAIAYNLGVYRPHEMVLVTSALGLIVAGAITAVPLVGTASRTTGIGTSLVLAIQWLLLVTVALVSGAVVIGVAVQSVTGWTPDVGALGVVVVAIAIAVLFAVGLRDWWHGSPRLLLVANALAAVVAVAVGIGVLLQGEGEFLSFPVEARVLAALVMVTVVVGAVGLVLVDPPPADDEGDKERRESDEVPRVADEGHPDRVGDGA